MSKTEYIHTCTTLDENGDCTCFPGHTVSWTVTPPRVPWYRRLWRWLY